MKKVIHVLFFVTQLNQQYWHLNLKAGKQQTNISQLIPYITILTFEDLQEVGGEITRNKCVYYRFQIISRWNHQPLLNTSKQTHSLLTAGKKYNKKKLRDSGLKLWLFWIFAIPGSKSPTLIYQKTSNDICLAGVFVTGQVSQHLYLFWGMVDPELKTSTKPLVFTIVFYVQFIHLQMNQVFMFCFGLQH